MAARVPWVATYASVLPFLLTPAVVFIPLGHGVAGGVSKVSEMFHRDLDTEGRVLREKILKFCSEHEAELRSAKSFDVSSAMSDFLQEGMSFTQAEELLKAAGFKVFPRPTIDMAEKLNRQLDVTAVLSLNSSLFSSRELYVSLRPTPGDRFDKLMRFEARLYRSNL